MSEVRWIRVNGITLAVRIVGSGSPIVLVHGSLDDHRTWQRVMPYLSDAHRVVSYDRRGHGGSTCPREQGTIGQDCADLAELARTLELEAPLMVGHSYGASTVLLLGARHPELTGGLLLHEPPLFTLLYDDEMTRQLAEVASEALRPELLADYPHRIVISHGDSGPPVYEPITEILAATIPTASRHVIKGAGHAPQLSHPEEFATLIRCCARRVTPRLPG